MEHDYFVENSVAWVRRVWLVFDDPLTRSSDDPIYSFCRTDGEQFLSVLDGLSIRNELLDQLSRNVAFDFVHQFHRFHNAQHLPYFELIAFLDEGRRPRRGRFVESANDGRL